MKKQLSVLAILLTWAGISYAQPGTVIESGVVYTRIRTMTEYLSLDGGIYAENEENSAKRKSGTTISCSKGHGCCMSGTVDLTGDVMNSFTLAAQTLDDGTTISEMGNVHAYYNAELDLIIYRQYIPVSE